MDKLKVKFKLKNALSEHIRAMRARGKSLASIEQTLDGFGQLDEQKEVNGANTPNFTTIGIKITFGRPLLMQI